MKQPAPARDWRVTPEEASGLINRITGDAVDWITLRDAFLYVWKQLKNSKVALPALRKKLEKGEIRSQAAIFQTFVQLGGKLITTNKWFDIPCDFWDGAGVDLGGRDLAERERAGFLYRAQGITIRTEDIFRIWPLPEPPVESKAPMESEVDAKTAHQGQPPAEIKVGKGDQPVKLRPLPLAVLKLNLAETLTLQQTKPQARKAAREKFSDFYISDSLFDEAWQAMPPTKARKQGYTDRTLQAKAARELGADDKPTIER